MIAYKIIYDLNLEIYVVYVCPSVWNVIADCSVGVVTTLWGECAVNEENLDF